MAKQITIEYKQKIYTLEFTRDSVKQLERSGFKIGELTDYPMMMLPRFFYGAFRANHPTVKQRLTDEILDNIEDKDGLLDKLSEMYYEPLDTLMEGGKGNIKWKATF